MDNPDHEELAEAAADPFKTNGVSWVSGLAMVRISVAIITGRRSMFNVAFLLGMAGTLCTLNGYFLFF